jgi:hypothetical protein
MMSKSQFDELVKNKRHAESFELCYDKYGPAGKERDLEIFKWGTGSGTTITLEASEAKKAELYNALWATKDKPATEVGHRRLKDQGWEGDPED